MLTEMLPLSLGLGEGGEQRAPMGQAVIGGVLTSGVLTLVVVPVVYTYLDDLVAWARRRRRAAGDAFPQQPANRRPRAGGDPV